MASLTQSPQDRFSLGTLHSAQTTALSTDRSWPFWPLVPIYPYGDRQTLCTEIVPDTIWTFDQLQGIFYVVVPIRMTVVKLSTGGLLVYAPVAPTCECMGQMQKLVAAHGEVKYIILPTVSGLEHKVFVGPFARQFPTAQVYVAPHQWSFPVNLPLSWLGLPLGRTHRLPEHSQDAPFSQDFDYAQLGPIDLGVGPFEEVAFFHRRSRSLLVTDSIVSVPATPPPILEQDPYPLLFHARETGLDPIEDTPNNRIKGWKRIALFALYFQPSALEVPTFGQVLRDAVKGGDRSKQGYFGLYPFRWAPHWPQSFDQLHGQGRLFVAPILQQLIFNRGSQQVLAWADTVAKWSFSRIIPCHFACPIAATPQQFRQAFTFLKLGGDRHHCGGLPAADFATMQGLDARLNQLGITKPPQ
ncbi:MAG: DUF4336 domain-containing protein [Merismopedia sp. SIO2A8]|nr:DUF4336 domain-containing protein [Merismopedia sp. SIO2A8]